MRTILIYPYDPQLRPGDIGLDLEDGNPNNLCTFRYDPQEPEDLERMMKTIVDYMGGGQ